MHKPGLFLFIASALLSGISAGAAPPVDQGSGPGYEQLQSLTAKAQDALDAGKTAEAAKYAKRLLKTNVDKTSWNYGNVIYTGNEILGLAALKEGNRKAANTYLLAAGATPGSPQLDSFGPDMALAKALYAKGERAVIIQFLSEVARFWAVAPAGLKDNKLIVEVAASNAKTIDTWKKQIKDGKTPSFVAARSESDETPATPLLAVGAIAPDFTVYTKDGKPVRLSDYRGKTVVLDFWATWCGPCQESLPHTNAVAKQFADKNVVVLAVNVWDEQKAFDDWLPKHPEYSGLTFAIDPTKEQGKDIASKLFHVSGIPTQYVIDGKGKIVKSFVGYDGPTSALADAVTKAK